MEHLESFGRRILLTFQVALLGMVTPQLRAVTVEWDEGRILGWCIYDGPIGTDEQEICSDIEAEVMAAYPQFDIEVIAKRLDAPQDINQELLMAWVYCRRE